jgi:uncharacterized membrane protein (DUF373 family)
VVREVFVQVVVVTRETTYRGTGLSALLLVGPKIEEGCRGLGQTPWKKKTTKAAVYFFLFLFLFLSLFKSFSENLRRDNI